MPCPTATALLPCADLDAWSLCTLGLVSRGFHLLAREPTLWATLCARVWPRARLQALVEQQRATLPPMPTPCWPLAARDLFLEQLHLWFHGTGLDMPFPPPPSMSIRVLYSSLSSLHIAISRMSSCHMYSSRLYLLRVSIQ